MPKADFENFLSASSLEVIEKFEGFSEGLEIVQTATSLEQKRQEINEKLKGMLSSLEAKKSELVKAQESYEKYCMEGTEELRTLEEKMKCASSLYSFKEVDGRKKKCIEFSNILKSYEKEIQKKTEEINETLKEIDQLTASVIMEVKETYNAVVSHLFEGIQKTTAHVYQASSEVHRLAGAAMDGVKIYEQIEMSYERENEYLGMRAVEKMNILRQEREAKKLEAKRQEEKEEASEEKESKEDKESPESLVRDFEMKDFLEGCKLVQPEKKEEIYSSFNLAEDPLIFFADCCLQSIEAYLWFFEGSSSLYESLDTSLGTFNGVLTAFLASSSQITRNNGLSGPEDSFYTRAFKVFDAHVIYILNNFLEVFDVLKKAVSQKEIPFKNAKCLIKKIRDSRENEFLDRLDKVNRLVLALKQTRESYIEVKASLGFNLSKEDPALKNNSKSLDLPIHFKIIRDNLYTISVQAYSKLQQMKEAIRKLDADSSVLVANSLHQVYAWSSSTSESVIQQCGMVSTLKFAPVPQVVAQCLKTDPKFFEFCQREPGLKADQLLQFQPRVNTGSIDLRIQAISTVIEKTHASVAQDPEEEKTSLEASTQNHPSRDFSKDASSQGNSSGRNQETPEIDKKQGFLAKVVSNLGVTDKIATLSNSISRGRSVSMGNQYKLSQDLAKRFGVSEKEVVRGKFVCVNMKNGIPSAGHVYLLEKKFCFEPAIAIGNSLAIGWNDILKLEKKDGVIDKGLEVVTKLGSISFSGVIHREDLMAKCEEIKRVNGLGEGLGFEAEKERKEIEYKEEEHEEPSP